MFFKPVTTDHNKRRSMIEYLETSSIPHTTHDGGIYGIDRDDDDTRFANWLRTHDIGFQSALRLVDLDSTSEIARVNKNDANFLCALELPTLQLFLFYTGGEKVEYIAVKNSTILFKGKDYRPSPLHGQDSLDSVVGLLAFLTVQEGDVEADYFKDYTPEQFAWCRSNECEQLKNRVSDYENYDATYNAEATEYFEQHYTV